MTRVAAGRSVGLRRRVVRHRADHLYVLPALSVMAPVIAYPLYYMIYLSVFSTPPNLALEDKVFVGFENNGRMLAADSFREATLNTLVWTILSTLVTVLLLVANLNSFTIPYIMTGGGPAGASESWITHIYQIAFGRIRFGLASAYSVILFIVMMGLGWFYVRALTGRPDRTAS